MAEKKIIWKQIILTGKGKPTFGYFLSLRVAYSVLLDTVLDVLIPLGWVGKCVCLVSSTNAF